MRTHEKRTEENIMAGRIANAIGIRTLTLPKNLNAYKKIHPQWCFVVFRRANAAKGMRHILHITKRRAWKHALEIAEVSPEWFLSDCGRSIILDDRPWRTK